MPPWREFIGEFAILELSEEYERRLTPHWSFERSHGTLLTGGDPPSRSIRRLGGRH